MSDNNGTFRLTPIILIALLHLASACTSQKAKPDAAQLSASDLVHVAGVAPSLKPCPDDEASGAVLKKLYPVLGRDSSDITEEFLNRQASRISCIRDWAKTLSDPCVRDKYLSWLEYFEGKITAQRAALRNGDTASDYERWKRQLQEKERRVREYEAAHPVPEPPSCEREVIRKVR